MELDAGYNSDEKTALNFSHNLHKIPHKTPHQVSHEMQLEEEIIIVPLSSLEDKNRVTSNNLDTFHNVSLEPESTKLHILKKLSDKNGVTIYHTSNEQPTN